MKCNIEVGNNEPAFDTIALSTFVPWNKVDDGECSPNPHHGVWLPGVRAASPPNYSYFVELTSHFFVHVLQVQISEISENGSFQVHVLVWTVQRHRSIISSTKTAHVVLYLHVHYFSWCTDLINDQRL